MATKLLAVLQHRQFEFCARVDHLLKLTYTIYSASAERRLCAVTVRQIICSNCFYYLSIKAVHAQT